MGEFTIQFALRTCDITVCMLALYTCTYIHILIHIIVAVARVSIIV